MVFNNLVKEIVFSLQITGGILGNVSLFFYYFIHYCIKQKLNTKDLILMHLFAANSLIIISAGMLKTMQTFEIKGFISDFVCKLILYIQRLGRSMSIGNTCILSVFQAITLSPSKSFLKDLKLKAAKYIGQLISLSWTLYVVINMIFPLYLYVKGNSKNMTHKRDLKYCSTLGYNEVTSTLYTVVCVLPEVLLSVIIAWSGGFVVIILHRHKQHVQHIHSTHVSTRASPESRATQNILILEFTFLGFYTFSSILQGWNALVHSRKWWLMDIIAITSMCFPSLSPIIMSNNSIMFKFLFCFMRNQAHNCIIGTKI